VADLEGARFTRLQRIGELLRDGLVDDDIRLCATSVVD
jgi:hypothetical protein